MSKKAADKDAVAAAGAVVASGELAGTDLALGGIEATDIFSLGTGFEAQTSSISTEQTRAGCKGADGDEVANAAHDTITRVSATYKYSVAAGAATYIPVEDLVVGSVKGGYHVDSVSIAGAVDWPTITVTGHNHATNPHAACAEYTPSLDEILCGFGCAEIFANAGAASSIVSYTYTIAVEHKDVNGKDGNHLAGDNAGCMETVQAQYYGVPTLTTTGWVVTASTPADSNADFDVVNITASKALTRDATP